MGRLIERWIDLRAGETRSALLALGTLLGIVGGHTLLETARDALFLGALPPSRLPLVYAALAGSALVVVRLNAAFVRRFGRRNALIFTLMGAAYGTVMLYLAPVQPMTIYALYLWSGTLSMVMVAQFWMLTGSTFTVTQGKRLFGPIAAGGVMGAVVGATVAALLLQVVDVKRLLPFAAGTFLATGMLLTSMDNDTVSRAAPALSVDAARPRAHAGLLWHDRYLRRLTLQTILIGAAVLVADYLFKSQIAQHVPPAELGAFLARYYAVLNAASLVVQLFIAGVAVRRMGVIAATAVLPAVLLAGGVGILATGGGLLMVLLTKGGDGALRHSLHRVTSELTWLPLSDEVKNAAKALVDTSVTRIVQAVTAALILALSMVGLDTPWVLAIVLIVLTTLALGGTMALRAPYVDLFRKALGRNDLPSNGEFRLDINGAEIAMEALSSRDHERVLAAIDLLSGQKRTRLIPALILYHDTPEVLVHALPVISTPDRTDWVPLAERLLSHAREDVRAAAVFALVGAGHTERVAARMSDESPRVRAQTAFVLAERERPEDPSLDARIVACLAMTGDEGLAARAGLLETIGTRGDRRWSPVLLAIAADPHERLDAALARAVAHVGDPTHLPLILARLGSRAARVEVRAAVASFGDTARDALRVVLADAHADPRVKLQIPATLALLGDQAAADVLVEQLTTSPNGKLRFRALKALVSMVEAKPLRIDADRVVVELRRNLLESFRLSALALPLAGDGGGDARAQASRELLVALLSDKQSQAVQRAFWVLQLLIRSENLRRVLLALSSRDARARANAAEFLDNLTLRYARRGKVHEESRALIQILSDELTPAERVERARPYLTELLPTWPADADAALGVLIRERDAGIATIAAEYAVVSGHRRLVGEVQSLSGERRFLDSLGLLMEEVPSVAG
jgi:AAA family ATP:ADP antiporter